MKQDEKRIMRVLYVIGIIPIIWIALLLAPYTKGGLIEIIKNGSTALNQPFKIVIVENSIRTILIFLIIYIFSILLYESTRKNYRRREENGSAKWGEAKELNKKYKQPNNYNKLLTKNVSVGLNGRKHRRNVNVLVIGGSGAGKTFSYCKPNVMQCATSYVILDPKGEIVRDTGYLLEKERI
jgi:type IV secretion system protein VirD4